MPPDTELPDAEQRNAIATLVAHSWREAAVRWGSLQVDGRSNAHALTLVLDALWGETDPVELGIAPDDPAFARIQAVAANGAQGERARRLAGFPVVVYKLPPEGRRAWRAFYRRLGR